jgi:hypothetical protein
MKSVLIAALALLSLIAISAATRPAPAGSSTLGVFVASSPCDAASRLLLKVPVTAGCELIKWHLTLRQDPSTLAPTTYVLTYTYGLPRQGTNGLAQGGTKVEREGRWSMVRGAATSPDAIVYRLDPDKPPESISFLKLDQNLIHLLDGDGKLVVGHAGWSFTLNRAGDYGRHTQQARPFPIPTVKTHSPIASLPPVTTDSSAGATFVGRSPCREVAAQLNKAAGAGCVKVKWELTLYQDPNSLTPTTYRLKGTFYRERTGEGRWTIIRGTKTDPSAVVYQLDPDKPQGSLLLLRADDSILLFLDNERNHMVGNGDFSYTLNRAKNVIKH